MKFVRHTRPDTFLDAAQDWLLQREAENNLILGLARDRVERAPGEADDAFFATVQEGRGVVGCVFRTPPLKLGLTRMPAGALPLVTDQVGRVYSSLPGVVGPPDAIAAFADLWCVLHGVESRPGMRMAIHALEQVVPLERPAPGRMRLAVHEDLPLVTRWCRRFSHDTGVRSLDPETLARELVEARALWLWELEGTTASMAAALGETPRGIRIGYVYTPPEGRGRGYATTLTASLSQRLLDRGRTFCFLYTDLDNPTSNRIYHRIGYRKVARAGEIHFISPALANPAGDE